MYYKYMNLLIFTAKAFFQVVSNRKMEALLYYYQEYQNKVEQLWELRDKRVDGWFMMDSFWPTVALGNYIWFQWKLCPKIVMIFIYFLL